MRSRRHSRRSPPRYSTYRDRISTIGCRIPETYFPHKRETDRTWRRRRTAFGVIVVGVAVGARRSHFPAAVVAAAIVVVVGRDRRGALRRAAACVESHYRRFVCSVRLVRFDDAF